MSSPILVTGGTGTLGRHVVRRLSDLGHPVRVLSRSHHEPEEGVAFPAGDLASGAGIDFAVDGVETIVHCAGTAKQDDVKARNLVRAAKSAGVTHLAFISVVGADRVPVVSRVDRAMFGYYASKRAAEIVVEQSGLPWTTLRATQFHDLIYTVVGAMAKLPVIPVLSGFRFQPVDTGEVAARLVDLALGAPAGLVPDVAGPTAYGMDELLDSYLQATHTRRATVSVRIPGEAARAIREGVNLAPDRAVGHRTWEEFLAEKVRDRG